MSPIKKQETKQIMKKYLVVFCDPFRSHYSKFYLMANNKEDAQLRANAEILTKKEEILFVLSEDEIKDDFDSLSTDRARVIG